MDRVDILIVGAGVTGLAAACCLAERWPDKSILLLEKHETFGQEITSRTSEVIHSGIYYPPGSLKARLCVAGNRLLYDFCEKHQVPYRRSGKLIIARDEGESAQLAVLARQAQENGVTDVEWLDRPGIARLEPHVEAVAALLSPSSGIFDSYLLMEKMAKIARRNGAMLVYRQLVIGIRVLEAGYQVEYQEENGARDVLMCRCLVNAAGMHADALAAMAGIPVDQAGYRIYRCKGEYFTVTNAKAQLVSRLIFPAGIRELKGSGLPVIKDVSGRLRIGPDAHYAPSGSLDYSVNPANAAQFLAIAGNYLPFLEAADLRPDLAAVRPRLLVPCGSPPRDFIVCHETERGLSGFINLIGIESPGITCCFSLAQMVGDMLNGVFAGT
ncbi:hypothetical protein P22_2087 [Propionispora sp. 2/2-37]|uniref:NAD(P)/FAD-dependent oxidoreductase n=1 Tax=Propionispora sp. 2/2-37 TaxID=1677858 RepID=UPI0006BB7FD0|nr:NAD(P)/FAD-dependent oxidoreductase [Propionispora sp. 2/2-37]CUH95999.1 hypothetical protein P22_2087 [Propionispora sp. 2/2-37]